MKNITYIIVFLLFIFCSCQSTKSIFREKKQKDLINTIINLAENRNNINPKEYYINIIFAKLEKEEDKQILSNSEYGIGFNFIKYSASCNANETNNQYIYKDYIITITDSITMDFINYSFFEKIVPRKLNYYNLPCNTLIYDPPYYGIYFDKNGIIQVIEPWKTRKSLRTRLLKNDFKINLKSEQVYAKFSEEDIEPE